MKLCSKCGVEKETTDFSIRRDIKRNSWCKECHRSYNKMRYYGDPLEKARILASNKLRKINNRKFITLSKDVPCADCGGRFPSICMDFDHLGDKSFTIAEHAKNKGIKTIQAEIDKCDVVCSNCHRIRTKERRLENDRDIQNSSKA